jgi:hypothetical protein
MTNLLFYQREPLAILRLRERDLWSDIECEYPHGQNSRGG